ncbi:MAG: recombinase family protein [Vicinamibacterales bacterium]|nr:recombinase family protein [Vicinamibacterales bacterium]
MTAIIYCRVSTKEQAQNLSLPTQRRACLDYCKRQGWEVGEEFEDAGESAKTTDRPAFQHLLDYCRLNKRRVQYVVVFSLSRFSRNTHDHHVIRALLLRLGVGLRSVSEPISDDSAGKLMENMLAAIAQFDNDQKAERTKAGMLAALQRGQWTWRAPLGYVNGDKRAGEASLVPDPIRGGLVRRAFELAASGEHAAADVLRTVTALGLISRRGRPLTPQVFGRLLRNPIYAGVLDVPRFGLRAVRGDFQALIPEVLFVRVQRVLETGGTVSHRLNNPDFPLRRFVVCGLCSTPMTGSAPRGRSKRYPYYHCRKCQAVRVRAETLEAQFIEALKTLKPRAEFMGLFRAIVRDVWRKRLADANILKTDMENRLAGLQGREGLLEDAYLYEKRIDLATYERQRDKLREKIALCRIELEDVRLEEIDVEGLLGFAEHVLGNAARLWVEARPEQKLRLQRALFPEGLRFKDGRFGTAVTCLAFMQLAEPNTQESSMASPTGFEPVF